MFASFLKTSTRKVTWFSLLLLFLHSADVVCGKRLSTSSPQHRRLHRRAIMMRLVDEPTDCKESSIAEKNAGNEVILTGTVSSCDGFRVGSYRCRIKVWRVMKGQDEIQDIISGEDTFSTTFTSNSFIDVYGFGNKEFCKSLVTIHDTKIFFMKRINGKVILGSSLMHITLKNLEDIQAVIEGREIEERPTKEQDPCLDVLCGYGAKCKIVDGLPTCVCPPVVCGEAEEVGEVEVAPLCGSDGITYPNECRLRQAQCKKQRRIKIISYDYCKEGEQLCADVVCSFGAKCQAVVDDLGEKEAQCKCETCAGVPVAPVCGSDQKSHRTECEMTREGCLQSKEITVLRRGPCDPCEMYNETLRTFVRSCSGICTIDDQGSARCCDDIICDNDEKHLVCGSDGRTYDSACSLEKQACRTARDIRIVATEKCGPQKPNTFIRGSFSIDTNENCPANCDVDSEEFQEFSKSLELKINERLRELSSDNQRMYDFEIEHKRENSITFFFRAKINTQDRAYEEDELPDERFMWAFERLFDPNNGTLTILAAEENLDLIHTENSAYNFFVEDVCLHHQCLNGARCMVNKSALGEFVPTCTCSAIADPDRLPYTFACKQADNQHMKYRTFSNKQHVRKSMCQEEPRRFYFVNICENQEPTANCADIGGCKREGETCVLTNGQPRCVCVSCVNKEARPVCASNGKTFRSKCELQQHNCERRRNLEIVSAGSCEQPQDTALLMVKVASRSHSITMNAMITENSNKNQRKENSCDGMSCPFYGECQLTSDGMRRCVCPTKRCPDDEEMVCGSNGMEFINECALMEYACHNEQDIYVLSGGGCDYDPDYETESGSGDCDCEFGTCKAVDDGYLCVCDFQCEDETTKTVCGSDGRTYRNTCELLKGQCDNASAITVVKDGACDEEFNRTACDCYWEGTISKQSTDLFACNPITKECACLPGVGGARCDRCHPGYWNFRAVAGEGSDGCNECLCNIFGSLRDDCDQMDGSCSCKPGVTGRKCDMCVSDGSKVTSSVCQQTPLNPDKLEPESEGPCKSLFCPPGKQCTVSGEDGFDLTERCECIPLSMCDGLPVKVVCGSDGITYTKECEMYAQTCPYGTDVQVMGLGQCEQDFDVTVPTTSATTTSTRVEVTSKPYDEDEGSGDPSGSNPTDDDEGFHEGSADKSQEELNGPDNDPTTHDYMMFGEGMFYWHDGVRMKYDYDLRRPESSIHHMYNKIVKNKILELSTSSAVLDGKIMNVLVKEYPPQVDHSTGVKVSFGLAIREHTNDMTTPEFVQNTLNAIAANSRETSDFKIWLPDDDDWVIPEFGGDSFIQFDQIEQVRTLNFTMSFKSYDNDGILFHLGKEGNFISVIIDQGRVVLKYDAGRGKVTIDKSRRNVTDGLWHIFFARLNRRDVMYQVDNEKPHYGDAPPARIGPSGLFPMNSVFIGGIDDSLQKTVEKQSGVGKGLTGCINDFTLYKGQMALNTNFKRAPKTRKINQCGRSPCYPNQCLNGANCLVTQQDNGGFTKTCLCNLCYEGERCENKINLPNPCLSNPCPSDQKCRPQKNNTSFHCLCLTDQRQEVDCATLLDSQFKIPTFNGSSFMKFNLSNLKTPEVININIIFSTTGENGLILYMGDGTPNGNMTALLLEDSTPQLISKVGKTEHKIRFESALNPELWHNIRITFDEERCMINIDNSDCIKVPINKILKPNFDMKILLLIGGVEWDENTLLANNISYLYDGLEGSVQKFSINDEEVISNKNRLINTKNIKAHRKNQCNRHLCKNGGICYPHFNGSYCQCPVGYTGSTCMTETSQTAIQFDGSTNARYQTSQDSSPVQYEEIMLTFKPASLNGTLLEISLPHDGGTESRNGSFSLTIFGDKVKAQMEMMDYTVEAISKTTINSQDWNTVKFEMWDDVTLLYLNGGEPSITRFQQCSSLKFGQTLLVGGGSGGYFRGCFGQLRVGSEYVSLSQLDRADGTGKFSACTDQRPL